MLSIRNKYEATRIIPSIIRSTRLSARRLFSSEPYLRVAEEIRQAIAERRPVVALESTIYTHGFPYPENLALAARLESLVRLHGGIPATIGILDGIARVGLNANELARLISTAESAPTLKVSRRDLALALGRLTSHGKQYNGGTTVSGTMVLAELAGIRIFATGGLGGVHRGAEETMDISADLTELGRTPVAVISSGCKSFLDIPKTLEYLETQGVAVATFADCRDGAIDFPAFYSRESGVRSPAILSSEREAAKVIHAHHALGLKSGLLFANPIPEQHSIPFERMENAISFALQDAKAAGATGALSTPYILARIKDLTGNQSLTANTALVEANVIRGTKVACELYDIEQEGLKGRSDGATVAVPSKSNVPDQVPSRFLASNTKTELSSKVFVAGSLAMDLACDYVDRSKSLSQTPQLKTSNPGEIRQCLGGVGHNVARAAHLMGANVRLLSVVGDDLAGQTALQGLTAVGMSVEGIKTLEKQTGYRTAQYVAINDAGKDLFVAVADMSILEISPSGPNPLAKAFEEVWLPQIERERPTHLVVDANWPPVYLSQWLQAGRAIGAHITFEPVSSVKSTALFQLPQSSALGVFPNSSVQLATPNSNELLSMHAMARARGFFERDDWWQVIDAFGIPSTGARSQLAHATSSHLVDQGIPQQALQLLPFIPIICTKLGSEGVLFTQVLSADDPRLNSKEAAPYILSRCSNGTEAAHGVGGVFIRLFPAVEKVSAGDLVSVNGVGDTFAGTLIAGLANNQQGIGFHEISKLETLISVAQKAAVLTLKSTDAVNPELGALRAAIY